jgi:formate-dependent nitrite reductase cytochrome c552 subunit
MILEWCLKKLRKSFETDEGRVCFNFDETVSVEIGDFDEEFDTIDDFVDWVRSL